MAWSGVELDGRHPLSLPLVGRVARSDGWGNVAARVESPDWSCTKGGWGKEPHPSLRATLPIKGRERGFF